MPKDDGSKAYYDYIEAMEVDAKLMRATGRCGRCREWLRYDEESGETIPHNCVYDSDYIDDAQNAFWAD